VILPTTTEFCLKLNLYYLILAPLLEFMEIFYCINHNVRIACSKRFTPMTRSFQLA
jgi:hypothetical protein